MRSVPPVHPEFMLEPIFDQIGSAARPSAWAGVARPGSTPAMARC